MRIAASAARFEFLPFYIARLRNMFGCGVGRCVQEHRKITPGSYMSFSQHYILLFIYLCIIYISIGCSRCAMWPRTFSPSRLISFQFLYGRGQPRLPRASDRLQIKSIVVGFVSGCCKRCMRSVYIIITTRIFVVVACLTAAPPCISQFFLFVVVVAIIIAVVATSFFILRVSI